MRQLKLAIPQLLGAHKDSVLYHINWYSATKMLLGTHGSAAEILGLYI